jgi:predicted GNAT family N-acyltransferase
MTDKNDVRVRWVSFEKAEVAIAHVRTQVFQLEQGVSAALDFDGLDPACWQILVEVDQQPVGTARVRLLPKDHTCPTDPVTEQELELAIAKIERLAILADSRRRGLGKVLVEAILQRIATEGMPQVMLHAQAQTVDFYQKFGFVPIGEPFIEAGISHLEMKLRTIDPIVQI